MKHKAFQRLFCLDLSAPKNATANSMSTTAVAPEEDMAVEESSNSGSGTPLPSNPATPLPSNPATPLPSNPATPLPSNPATPMTSNPGTPRSMDTLEAKSSNASNPGTPLSAETDSKSAMASDPATPLPSNPGTPRPQEAVASKSASTPKPAIEAEPKHASVNLVASQTDVRNSTPSPLHHRQQQQAHHPAVAHAVPPHMVCVPGVVMAPMKPPKPQPSISKYAQLLNVIEDMGKDIRPTYAGSKSSTERLKRGIVHARILVRECLMECERAART
ncbi:Cyclin-dependent kinase 2-associated protein 2 [Lamellibrachia satsuma]|nr:Cyclin-dependent kinase 2-associated protein 2 [Lamellibrachia satsuma]